MTPNHALQRTAPCVTAPASTAAFPPTMQVPRRTPLSLSLRSLGVATRVSSHESQQVADNSPRNMQPRQWTTALNQTPSRSAFASGAALYLVALSPSSSLPVRLPHLQAPRGQQWLESLSSSDSSLCATVTSSGAVSQIYSVEASFPTAATPNHALQRTAPRVTVAAISSSDPSRPSHLCL